MQRMQHDLIISALFLVFAGAAVLSALALYARQSLLVAYIALGALLGPWGFSVVKDLDVITEIGHVGIFFLLFLLGLDLQPQQLLRLLREATRVTVVSSLVFGILGWLVAWSFGFATREAVVIGSVMMFSSTIIGLKLLPTTELHHRHMGEIIISVLLLQDILAIGMLLVLGSLGEAEAGWTGLVTVLLSLPGIVLFAFVFERYVLLPLIQRFDTIREYIFLTAVGWCLGVAQLAHVLGLSFEIGAFIAGVALASSPIAMYIADSLKPLRDFFLIMFFFSLGASFELPMLPQVAFPALLLAGTMLVAKPLVFGSLLAWEGEAKKMSFEIGFRLGQVSEFSLLIAVLAVESGVIGERASYLIQAATLCTFILSSYIVMLRFPTPIAVSDRLRRD